jgi:iron complex transport system substrate-binding protein
MSFCIPSGPARIVCLTEEPTEILYALGEQDRIVGISAYTERPPEAKRDKPVVSAFIDGSVQKISALQPDLVIGFSDIQAELARKLIANNLNVLIFNQRSIQEILGVVVDVGRLVGRRAEAEDLVAGYIGGIEAAQDRASKRGLRPRVYFEEWDDPMISAIAWVSELIEIAGGEDIFADRAQGKLAKERFVQPGEVIAAAPEIMLASWCGKPFEAEKVRAREGWGAIPALLSGRVHEIPSADILQPGPACLTTGLDTIERLIVAVPASS